MTLTDGPHDGPIFLGTLKAGKADGVSAANNLGLWAVDSGGALRLLLRTGQSVTVNSSKTLKTFAAP